MSSHNRAPAKRRLCFPDGHLPSGAKVRAACHCGFVTTPRVSIERADEALEVEHGWTEPPNGCAICRLQPGARRPWDVFRPLDDEECEFWVCRDTTTCSARYKAAQAAATFKCGCSHILVEVFGHYHSPQLMSDVAGGVAK